MYRSYFTRHSTVHLYILWTLVWETGSCENKTFCCQTRGLTKKHKTEHRERFIWPGCPLPLKIPSISNNQHPFTPWPHTHFELPPFIASHIAIVASPMLHFYYFKKSQKINFDASKAKQYRYKIKIFLFLRDYDS